MDVCKQSETLKSVVGPTNKTLIQIKGHTETKKIGKMRPKFDP